MIKIKGKKMNHKTLHFLMFALLLVVLFIPSAFSQTSNLIFTNDVLVNSKTWTVDIYLQSTSADPIELAILALGLEFPDATTNGGTITASWVAGSSELSNINQLPSSPGNTTSTVMVKGVLMRVIKMAGRGDGGGSMISTAAPYGTRIGKLQIINSVDWPTSAFTQPNTIDTAFHGTGGYPWSFNAYVGGLNTNITALNTVVKILTGPLLPIELSSFASATQGRTVVLNWSTKTEKNSDKFVIEREVIGADWESIGSVKAAVLSNSPKQYSFTDKNLQSGKYQYRLKMIDNDGSFSYSSVGAVEITIPKDFAVSQNYPNPFNPSTKIDYQVPVDAKVILEVYNIAGQKVVELVNQEQSAGYYTVDFGASKLSSGVYIYRIVASDKATGNNFSSIKKMMLLK
jgi:hypothetical protein